MIQFLKRKLFGSKIFQRTNSLVVNSKWKRESVQKKPLSIDSKQKQQSFKQLQRKQQCPEIIEFDSNDVGEHASTSNRINFKGNQEDIDNIIISDTVSSDRGYEDLLSGLNEQTIEYTNSNFQVTTCSTKGKQLIPNYISIRQANPAMNKAAFNQGKILVKRSNSRKAIKKIQQRCSACKNNLSLSDSIQLACTHRCHKACAVKMQWRMKYKCDLCESKNEKKQYTAYK